MDITRIEKLEELLELYNNNEVVDFNEIQNLLHSFEDSSELFRIAYDNNYQNIIDLITGNYDKINFKYKDGNSLFSKVCQKDNPEIIKNLI